LPGMHLWIATGLRDDSRPGAPDVMRGEETQIFGALILDDALREGSQLLVLPGTHSKWVDVQGGVIVRFRTALTGEMFALLRDHSILLKTGDSAPAAPGDSEAGFVAGAQRATHLTEGLLGALFEARTAQLLQQRSRAWAEGLLSGLLIGAEIAGMSSTRANVAAVKIIGDAQLAALYRQVFELAGVAAQVVDGAACAIAGLQQLHERLPGGGA